MRSSALANKKFGRLTAVKPTGRRIGTAIEWLCLCECGNETTGGAGQLNAGRKVSCGCFRDELTRERMKIIPRGLPPGEAAFNKYYDGYRRDASTKGIKFKLTKDEFRALTKNNCEYCGSPPVRAVANKRAKGEYLCNGVDRIDSARDYVTENVVTACKTCNLMKNALSVNEFVSHVKKIASYQGVTA